MFQQDLFAAIDAEDAREEARMSEALSAHHAGARQEQVPFIRLAWGLLAGAAKDIAAGLELDDPFGADTAETANNFLLAIDWLNGDDGWITVEHVAGELGFGPRFVRQVVADKFDLKTRGQAAFLVLPDWFAMFASCIPAAAVEDACAKAQEDRLKAPTTKRRISQPLALTDAMTRWAAKPTRKSREHA